MADSKNGNGNGGSPKLLVWGLFLLFAGIGVGAFFLYKEADRARSALADAKREYEEMERFKVIVAKGKSQSRRLPNRKDGGEDILPFLEKKRAAAGIPQALFNVQPLIPVPYPGWKEFPYTITLRGTKDAPVSRDAVADFLVAVETERPSVKSKHLNLSFAPSSKDLASATVTVSQFRRE